MSQCSDILAYLQDRGRITPIEALEKFHCFRLAARIEELRHLGYPIKTTYPNGANYATYTMDQLSFL